MLGWLYRVIIGKFKGCDHQWKVIDSRRLMYEEGYFNRMVYTLQCKHCGDIKQKNIK